MLFVESSGGREANWAEAFCEGLKTKPNNPKKIRTRLFGIEAPGE
jgi:hypothetical protein